MKSEECKITFLVVNILDYVSMCERLPSARVLHLLNDKYYPLIHREILQREGKLDQMVGDRQYAYWQQTSNNNSGLTACRAALSILQRMQQSMSDCAQEEEFKVNMAIATGVCREVNSIVIGELVSRTRQMIGIGKVYQISAILDMSTMMDITGHLRATQLKEVEATDPFGPLFSLDGGQ